MGLVAGACLRASTQSPQSNEEDKPVAVTTLQPTGSESRSLGDMAKNHIHANKYEYAGATGVIAGAAAGSVLGPMGTVAGAVAGAVSSRKLVERASQSSSVPSTTATTNIQSNQSGSSEKPYRFGDITRRVVSRGKEARGANDTKGYRFGDFSRGLFAGRKQER